MIEGMSSVLRSGITVVLPLEQSARKRDNFPSLMTSAMLVCGLLYGVAQQSQPSYVATTCLAGSFGAIGYAVYGSTTEESILKNLPDSSA